VSIFLQDFLCFCVHLHICHIHTPWCRVLEKLTWLSASKEIPCILWNLKVHYHFHTYYMPYTPPI
jgi:hypothetical protein